jgi:hypothetical protein
MVKFLFCPDYLLEKRERSACLFIEAIFAVLFGKERKGRNERGLPLRNIKFHSKLSTGDMGDTRTIRSGYRGCESAKFFRVSFYRSHVRCFIWEQTELHWCITAL